MNRSLVLLIAGASALALAGCGIHPPKGSKSILSYKTISRLECPSEKGDLKLVGAAPDGKSCDYEGDDAQVTLKLVSLNGGDARTALSPIEVELKSLMPQTQAEAAKTEDKAGENHGEQANIDLPGVHIHANDRGATVRVAGVNVDARDDSSEVRINHNVGGDDSNTDDSDGSGKSVSIKSDDGDDTTEVRSSRKSRKHHGSMTSGIRATYILVSDKDTTDYRLVGYEARGPKDGPIAVAIVKSKQSNRQDHDVFSDAKALITANIGGMADHINID